MGKFEDYNMVKELVNGGRVLASTQICLQQTLYIIGAGKKSQVQNFKVA